MAGVQFRSDRIAMMDAVLADGAALQYASEELQNDPELVMAAVKNNWMALKYAGFYLSRFFAVHSIRLEKVSLLCNTVYVICVLHCTESWFGCLKAFTATVKDIVLPLRFAKCCLQFGRISVGQRWGVFIWSRVLPFLTDTVNALAQMVVPPHKGRR